jgi:hypothetical protein
MTSFLLSVLFYLPLLLGIAALVAEKQDRLFLFRILVLGWIGLAPLVAIMNQWMPFADGGDDYGYYMWGQNPITSLGGVFDFAGFVGLVEQPGYPWLLSLLNLIAEGDLLSFKLLNLFFLLALSLIWYRIGVLLETPRFGRRVLLGSLLLTPLWYYVFFLLKDLAIALLQSLFLLGIVWQWTRVRVAGPWLLAGAATFSLVLFRVPIVLHNIAVALGALVLMASGRGRERVHVLSMMIGAVVMVALIAIASDPQSLSRLGIVDQSRVLFSDAMSDSVLRYQDSSQTKAGLFPLLYLLSETTGLNPNSWSALDSSWLRGVLAIPWVFFVVPFFGLGVLWMFHAPRALPRKHGLVQRLRSSRLVATPWGVLALFIMTSFAVSWTVGDSTRWRISDMPAILTVAMAGWTFVGHSLRHDILFLLIFGGGSLILFLYILCLL